MDNKQKINCTVQSCKYNNGREQLCELNAIGAWCGLYHLSAVEKVYIRS